MRIGILTGGGDAPGLNGIIESATKTLINKNVEVIGICDGFEGVFNNNTINLNFKNVDGIHCHAGTLLGTSSKCGTQGREEEFLIAYKKLNLDGLIAAGGDGTFRGLMPFKDEINILGVPKTIDNDLNGTDRTFGFDTACSVVSESIDSLKSTAYAHKRVIVLETMGRTAGWIALGGGIAGFSDAILIPELPFDSSKLLAFINNRMKEQRGMIITVSEGAHAKNEKIHVAFKALNSPQVDRLGGIAEHLSKIIFKETGHESRHVVLGHLQRAKAPTTIDRFFTLEMGTKVAELCLSRSWNMGISMINGKVVPVPIGDFMGEAKLVPKEHNWVNIAQKLGIFI